MKTNALLAFFFSLFFFSRADYVYDSDGEIVYNGGIYYIMPPRYGGVVIEGASISKGEESDSCSIAVASVLSSDKGWPTKTSTPYPVNFITNDYPLNISFAALPSNACTNIPSWIVTNELGFGGDPVMVGDPEEFSDPRSGDFYIKKYDSTEYYMFAFCYSTASCGYVTLETDSHGNDRLIITQDSSVGPLAFKLVRETSDDVVSGKSMVV